jgi:hypothetical protein
MPSSRLIRPLTHSRTITSSVNNPSRSGLRRRLSLVLSRHRGEIYVNAWINQQQRIYAERIICNGEKTLELIQALQISSRVFSPEHFEELKFYQLIHIAAVMAIDIGLAKRSKSKGPRLWRDLWPTQYYFIQSSIGCPLAPNPVS